MSNKVDSQKKIKILYTTPNFDTAGSGKVIYDLVANLNRELFSPEILVKHTRGSFFKEIEKLNVPIHVFPYETSYYPLWSFTLRLWKVVRFFKSLNVDIIHSWHWSSDFSEPLAARIAGIKFIYTKKAMGWGNKSWRWRSKLSNHIVAINKTMMIEFFDNSLKEKSTFLPLGIDTEVFSPQTYNSSIAAKYQIDKNDFVIITVVNMVPVKGIEILIEAVILSKIPNAKLLIVGDDQNDYGKQLKEKYKSQKNITFTGKQIDEIGRASCRER